MLRKVRTMLIMTEEEARSIMKKYGWSYKERRRRGQGKKYLYAQRWLGKGPIERYICPLSQLGELTEKELVAKLARIPTPTEGTSSAAREPEVSNTPHSLTNTDNL